MLVLFKNISDSIHRRRKKRWKNQSKNNDDRIINLQKIFWEKIIITVIALYTSLLLLSVILGIMFSYQYYDQYGFLNFIIYAGMPRDIFFAVLVVLIIYVMYYQEQKKDKEYIDSIIMFCKKKGVSQEYDLGKHDKVLYKLEDIINIEIQKDSIKAAEKQYKKNRENDMRIEYINQCKSPLSEIIAYLEILENERDISQKNEEKYINIVSKKLQLIERDTDIFLKKISPK